MPRLPSGALLLLFSLTPTLLLADSGPGVVHVTLPKDDVTISFVESRGGMTVELKCKSASVCGHSMYIGDGSIALPMKANNSGIWLQETTKYRQGDRLRVGSRIHVRPAYKSVRDIPKGNVYVELPGVTFVLPKFTRTGYGRVFNLEPSSSGFRSVVFNSDGAKVALSSVREMRILDVTSRGPEPWVRFSPFFPHGGIPVPLSPGVVAQSVEGIWQGLKVFETCGIDVSKFEVTSMKGLKRTVRKHGRVLGHQAGVGVDELLAYVEARSRIYLPAYTWVLEKRLADLVAELRGDKAVVLLDYETNEDVKDTSRPLSHAALVKQFCNAP